MEIDTLRLLLDYHYWARDRMLDAVEALPQEQSTRDLGTSFGSVLGTLVHVYSAEWAWHSRWRGHSPTALLPMEMFPTAGAVRQAWLELEPRVRGVLEDLGPDGIDRVFEYRLLSGTPGRTPFWQMLQHAVNHATYHRGQITTLLRQLGATPPKSTDLIAYYRERHPVPQDGVSTAAGTPLVCNLDAIAPEDRSRYQESMRRVFGAATDARELADGYAFRLTGDRGTIAAAAEFIALERLCCPFLSFALEIPAGADGAWLRVTGPARVKAFVRDELAAYASHLPHL